MIGLLRIRNLAVIEALELELGPGLNVITGETGAGKSMLVAALQLLRGGRAAAHLVRTGEETATVEALVESGGTEEVVKRVVRRNGRSHAYLDGELCTVADLKARAAHWLDLSSQHEHHTLADPASHLEWLDRFAGQGERRRAVAVAVAAALEARRTLERFRERAREAADRLDLLRFQAAEIERIGPRAGELDEVLALLDRLEHLEELTQLGEAASEALHGDRSAVSAVQTGLQALRRAARLDPVLAPLVARLESVQLELEDLAAEVAGHTTEQDVEPERLDRLRDRELALSRLVRRHGSLAAALERLEDLGSEIAELEDADATLATLQAKAEDELARAGALARALSETRRARAADLGRAVSEQLAALGMGQARIQVSVEPLAAGDLVVDGARLGPNGLDRVEFLIAPNPGEDPRPLAKIASGGELSRALLALKQVLAGVGPVSTYVFDEVDTGVGGAVAERIGRKLAEVSRHHQVICITHQAVIAAWADAHHVVSKHVDDGRTRTVVHTLSPREREAELARMLGGMEVTDGVRQAAVELLQGASR